MKKLKLNLEELKVESFETTNKIFNKKGTVKGQTDNIVDSRTVLSDCDCPETYDTCITEDPCNTDNTCITCNYTCETCNIGPIACSPENPVTD